jgi:chromatin structure-remodeling complex subunit SFH1
MWFHCRTDKQLHAQTTLPLTLIPIRIDLDIPSFVPHPALPLPTDIHNYQINTNHPAYKTPDPTPPYRLKDVFLWNLHETLITPDQFANILINDLDLPNTGGLAVQVATQIRTQLEEYAGVALHPLFHSTSTTATNGAVVKTIQAGSSRDQSATPVGAGSRTPLANGNDRTSVMNGNALTPSATDGITASASQHPASASDEYNPDDTYRCIVTLNIHLQNKLFTDKFEWSLLHPPGVAERFAKQTCADMSLSGEWIPTMTHAIYEAVLRLKKEACESGGLVGGNGYGIANDALDGQEAGWRYDNEHLADEWEPKIERLSKEEIEKREGDRERQIRRLRRETARFSSTTNMVGGMPTSSGYFDQPESSETPMGRGERSKRKRRFRSLSPLARSGTPGARGMPDTGAAGYGGGGALNDWYVMLSVVLGVLLKMVAGRGKRGDVHTAQCMDLLFGLFEMGLTDQG